LKDIAESSGMKLLADEEGLKSVLARGNADKRIAPIRIRHEHTITPLNPYQYSKFTSHHISSHCITSYLYIYYDCI